MPPDVLLMLASSGITLIASLMFFVSPEQPPAFAPGPEVTFCAPPPRGMLPPPLPSNRDGHCVQTPGGMVSIHHVDGEWVFVHEPRLDANAVLLNGHGKVDDIRWHGRAGLQTITRQSWKQRPGKA